MPDWMWEFVIGGVLAGLSRYGLPGRPPGGLVASALVGIGGSLAAALLGDKMGWYREGTLEGLFACGAGAIAALALYRFLSGTTAKAGAHQNYDL